jgi:hypothetical protein
MGGQDSGLQTAVRMDPPRTFRRVPLLPHQMLDRVTSQRDLFVLGHVGIWGWAWADGGVASVEISTDGGASWRGAALAPQSGWAWA